MRILHFIPQFPYFGGRTVIGGHASCLLSLSLAQAATGHEVTIISCVHRRGRCEIDIEENLTVHGLLEDARPGRVTHGLKLRAAAAAWLRQNRGRFDVVHGHSGFADYLMVSARLRKIAGLPTLHTLYCPIPTTGGRWRLPVVHGLINRWARSMDHMTAISENVASSMRAFGMTDVRVITPSVDLQRFHPADEPGALRGELGLGEGEVAVLFVGNAKPQKNLAGTLDALAIVRREHPETKLVITTELEQSTSDEDLNRVRQRLIKLGLESSVVQRGIVDNMPELMAACDILVAPFVDSYGPSDYFMAVLEAMAAGKPTVVSAVGGMPEVIDEEVGRLVDPHDTEALAEAIGWFVADARRRADAGRNARLYAERHFNPSHVVRQYEELYTGSSS